jgi:hypothetical protein
MLSTLPLVDTKVFLPGLVGWTDFPQSLQILGQEKKIFAHAFVLLGSFLYLSVFHEILKLVVSAQTQHFLAAAARIPSPHAA